MSPNSEPSFLRMMALVAGIVVAIILIFFAIGYAIGRYAL